MFCLGRDAIRCLPGCGIGWCMSGDEEKAVCNISMGVSPNCGTEMESDYTVKTNETLLSRIIVKKGRTKLAVKAWVCPNCGKIELYVEKYEGF